MPSSNSPPLSPETLKFYSLGYEFLQRSPVFQDLKQIIEQLKTKVSFNPDPADMEAEGFRKQMLAISDFVFKNENDIVGMKVAHSVMFNLYYEFGVSLFFYKSKEAF